MKILYAIPLVLLFSFSIVGCSGSEISKLKDSPSAIDNSITTGNLFDTYQFFTNTSWTQHKTDRGQEYIEFRARYSTKRLLSEYMNTFQVKEIPDKILTDLTTLIDKSGFHVDFVAHYAISVDKKQFTLSFIGFQYNNKNYPYGAESILTSLQRNKPMFFITPDSIEQLFYYSLQKYIFTKLPKEDFTTVSIPEAYSNVLAAPKPMPTTIYKVVDITFDDINLQTILTLDIITLKQIIETRGGIVPLKEFPHNFEGVSVLQKGSIQVTSLNSPHSKNLFLFDSSRDAPFRFSIHYLITNFDNLAPKVTHIVNDIPLTQEHKDFINQKYATGGPVNQKYHGTYIYLEEGFDGELNISPDSSNTNQVSIDLSTANLSTGHMCSFEGLCYQKGLALICSNEDLEPHEKYVQIQLRDNSVEIDKAPFTFLCGMSGSIFGEYEKR